MAEGTTSDSLVYLFGCYVFYEEFCGKNLLIIFLFCRIEKSLPVSQEMSLHIKNWTTTDHKVV